MNITFLSFFIYLCIAFLGGLVIGFILGVMGAGSVKTHSVFNALDSKKQGKNINQN